MTDAQEHNKRAEHFRRYSLARWLIMTHATDEIKRRWLKQWPFLRPYLRILTLCEKARHTRLTPPRESFLHYWKSAIDELGQDLFQIRAPSLWQATSREQLIPVSLSEFKSRLPARSASHQQLLGLIFCLYHIEDGQALCEELNIPFSKLANLPEDQRELALNLMTTYRGF